jgi:hypothetical protein
MGVLALRCALIGDPRERKILFTYAVSIVAVPCNLASDVVHDDDDPGLIPGNISYPVPRSDTEALRPKEVYLLIPPP